MPYSYNVPPPRPKTSIKGNLCYVLAAILIGMVVFDIRLPSANAIADYGQVMPPLPIDNGKPPVPWDPLPLLPVKKTPAASSQNQPQKPTIRHGVPVPRADFNKTVFNKTVKRVIANHEGFCARAYRCPAGYWTIGYGSRRMPNGRRVKRGDTITQAQAERLLMRTVDNYAKTVERRIKHPLSSQQKAALVSFAYNVGEDAFERSSVARHADRGNFREAAQSLLRYVHARGRKMPGLVARRREEVKLLKGSM